jgi:cysteine-rich repeat protein
MHVGEECDDANGVSGDGCSALCFLERGYCSDCLLQRALGEQCESALHNPALPYGCGTDCRFLSKYCGNGALNRGEQCDDGPLNSENPGARCRTNCSLARCGDRVRDFTEQCDDGNLLNGDGCSSVCALESSGVSAVRFPPPTGTSVHFPTADTYKRVAPTLPLASILPLDLQPIRTQTGPAAIAVMSAGAALGYAWIRRKSRLARKR